MKFSGDMLRDQRIFLTNFQNIQGNTCVVKNLKNLLCCTEKSYACKSFRKCAQDMRNIFKKCPKYTGWFICSEEFEQTLLCCTIKTYKALEKPLDKNGEVWFLCCLCMAINLLKFSCLKCLLCNGFKLWLGMQTWGLVWARFARLLNFYYSDVPDCRWFWSQAKKFGSF